MSDHDISGVPYTRAFLRYVTGQPLSRYRRRILALGRDGDGYRVPPHLDPTVKRTPLAKDVTTA